MLGKKISINGLYFARNGAICYSKIRGIVFKPQNHICIVKKNDGYYDFFSGKQVLFFKNCKSVGQFCIDEDSLEPLNHVFDHPKIKIITKNLIKRTLNELDKPIQASDFGKCYTAVCKYNKITYREMFEFIKDFHGHNEDKVNKTNKVEKNEEKEMEL